MREHFRPVAAVLAVAIFVVAYSAPAQAGVSTFSADLAKDIAPGEDSSFPSEWTVIGETLFIVADDGTHGRELWRSDGTAAGTTLVKDIFAQAEGIAIPKPEGLTPVGDRLLFTADDGTHGRELWVSNGTPEGTVMVKDITPGEASTSFGYREAVGDLLFFVLDSRELWRSDGTPEGTVMVKELGEHVRYLAAVGDSLFFVGGAFGAPGELWRSDGSEAGTTMLRTFEFPSPQNLAAAGGTLFFQADDGTNGNELWKSDGTAEGTVMVRDIRPGESGSVPATFLGVDDTLLFFTADDGANGRELWRSDGTAQGTVMVRDIRSDSGSRPLSLTLVDGSLFFSADDGERGREPWISDGTAAGTRIVKDIHPGGSDSHSMEGSGGNEFPTSTGVAAGQVFFLAKDGSRALEPWQSDGTAAGTMIVRDIDPDGRSPSTPFVAIGDSVLFAAHDDEHGNELWAARPLKSVAPCPDDPAIACVSGPADFTAFEHDVRILSGAGEAEIVVTGDDNDVSIENGFAGSLTAIGDQNRIDGSDGGDEIATTGCANVVRSRAGDDDVVVDDFDGCSDRTALVRAGGGDDRVVSQSDELAVLKGERGDDRLNGGGGNDRIRGGKGEDRIKGRAGADRVRGGRDNDVIRGGRGHDRVQGNAGDDVVRGERGHDRVHGNTGDDVIMGNQGRDRVFGGKQDDRLFGGKHNDVLNGGLGDDACRGGHGNDVFRRCG